MFIKRKKEGGFINPAYEKFERVMGIVTFIVIFCLFITLVIMAICELGNADTI
jgi:hypothetical protein